MIETLSSAIIAIFIGIASLFYSVLESLANLFSELTIIKIMSSDLLIEIYRRVGLILALYMLLKLTISGIQMIVNPDIITDKERGVKKILTRIIIAILLLGFTPTIFSGAFNLQKKILDQGVISKIVLGEDISSDNFGSEFAAALFVAGMDDQNSVAEFEKELKYDFESYTDGAEYFTSIGSAFMCLIIGGFACWMFLMYTISLAIRVIQLCFLEIIAPIPIMSSISTKKETAISSWIKQCLATYLDVFIRLFIIYLLILIERLIIGKEVTTLSGDTYNASLIIKILLMLGALLFAKKAPDLLKELFPGFKTKAVGDLGFGLKSRTDIPDPARRLIGAGLGAPIGAVARMGTRAVAMGLQNKSDLEKGNIKKRQAAGRMAKALGTGLLTGLGSGIAGGITAKKGVLGGIDKNARAKMISSNDRFVSNQTKGYGIGERFEDYMASKLGFKNYVQQLKTEKFGHEGAKSGVKILEDYHDFAKKEALKKLDEGEYMDSTKFNIQNGGTTVRDAAIKAVASKKKAEEYSNQNSQVYKDYQELLSDAEQAGNQAEVDRLRRIFAAEQQQAKLEADKAEKEYIKEYATFTTSSNAGSATNNRLKTELKHTQTQLEQHNENYKGIDVAQIEYSLSNDFSDLDDFIKNKGNYDPTRVGSRKGALTIRQNAEEALLGIDAQIKEREEKMSGNKSGK